jgi:homoserine O-acetyltransferase/O-succinyltransferase
MLGSCYGSTGPGSVDPETGKILWTGLSAGFDSRQRSGAGQAAGLAGHSAAAAGSGRLHRRHAGPGLGHPRSRPRGAGGRHRRGAALGHGAGAQPPAAPGHPARPGVGGRLLSAPAPSAAGLALARQIAMLSYKSAELFDERFGRNPNRNGEDPWGLDDLGGGLIGGRFDIAGYLDHQGERFIDRFDANSYLAILRTMDTWDPLRGFPRRRRPLAGFAPGSALSASARIGSFRPGSARLCLHDSRRRRSGRLPGDDQRPRPRRLPGRTGGTGAVAAIEREKI